MENESIANDYDERYLNQFDDVYLDPAISEVLKNVTLYNQLLSSEYVGAIQIDEIMNELDQQWQTLLGDRAVVTGFMSFTPEDQDPGSDLLERSYYEGQDIIFGGVLPVPVDKMYSDDESEDCHKYVLMIRVTREGITRTGKYLEMKGSAAVDDIISLEFKESMSIARAQKWLEYYHSDSLEDIDAALLNPSMEECEMVMRLEDMDIEVSAVHDGDEALMLRSSQALQVYSNNLFSFDSQFPYELEALGDAWMVVDGEPKAAEFLLTFNSLVTVKQLLWLSSPDGNTLYPHLDMTLVSDDKDAELPQVYVPLSSISQLRSLRHEYFVGYEDQL